MFRFVLGFKKEPKRNPNETQPFKEVEVKEERVGVVLHSIDHYLYKTLCTLFLWFFLFASAKRAEPRGLDKSKEKSLTMIYKIYILYL